MSAPGDKIPRSPPRPQPEFIPRHSPSKSMNNNNSRENFQGSLNMRSDMNRQNEGNVIDQPQLNDDVEESG